MKNIVFSQKDGVPEKMQAVIPSISQRLRQHVDKSSAAFFPAHEAGKKFLSFAQRFRNPSFVQAGLLWADRWRALPGASGIPAGKGSLLQKNSWAIGNVRYPAFYIKGKIHLFQSAVL